MSRQAGSTPRWRTELAEAIADPHELSRIAPARRLAPDDIAAACAELPARIPRPYARLIDPDDPRDPIAAMVIPDPRELQASPDLSPDPLHEERDTPLEGLIHRYPDRALLLVTGRCASYCRFCMRRRKVGRSAGRRDDSWLEQVVDYLDAHPRIHEVILSGGDPLVLSDTRLERCLDAVSRARHVELIRIDTRVPVVLPSRVDATLALLLGRFAPLWLVTHFNHPRELTPASIDACAALADAGIPLQNQAVLLAGVNDGDGVIEELCRRLLAARVRPYYLHQCDLVDGAGHFRTPLRSGTEIINGLCGRIAGMGIPRFVVDSPAGHGKVALAPAQAPRVKDQLLCPDGVTVPYPDIDEKVGRDSS